MEKYVLYRLGNNKALEVVSLHESITSMLAAYFLLLNLHESLNI